MPPECGSAKLPLPVGGCKKLFGSGEGARSEGGHEFPRAMPMRDATAPVLSENVGLFAGVDGELVNRITREMCRTYQQGEALCREGDPAEHLYVILRGVASVVAGGETIATRGGGAVIGEQAFIERTRRGATVTAVSQVDALRIPHVLVEDLLANPTFARNLL